MSFYAVRNGLIPGVYTNWSDCKKQVDGFKGAKYKKFPSEREALDFIGTTASEASSNRNPINRDTGASINNKKATTTTTKTVVTTTTTTTTTFLKPATAVKRKNTLTAGDNQSVAANKSTARKTIKIAAFENISKSSNKSTAKKTVKTAALENHYLCSENAAKNFYLDARHSNNLPNNNENEDDVCPEPALKKIKREPATAVKIEFIPSDLINNVDNMKSEPNLKIKKESPSIDDSLARECLLEYSINDRCDFTFSGKIVTVYTDGACSGNGQKNSAAAVGVFWGPSHPLNAGRKLQGIQTNNRAEITAAILAISQAIVYEASELTLNTDSQFMIKCMESWIQNWKRNGWQTSAKQPVKNIDDLKRLDHLCNLMKINWVYCPGHKGVYGNEEADKLATGAVER